MYNQILSLKKKKRRYSYVKNRLCRMFITTIRLYFRLYCFSNIYGISLINDDINYVLHLKNIGYIGEHEYYDSDLHLMKFIMILYVII